MHYRFLTLTALAVALFLPQPGHGQSPTVKTVEFDSASVARKMKYNIVLPVKYADGSERYPVLYLLHGYSSNYTAWARMGVPEYAQPLDLIVVMPDAGNSWYVNWASSEGDKKNNWEDAIIKDLIGHVDGTYRTIARREGRAINGLSMGGYGALMLGLKHPDMFCSVGTHSGALSFARSYGEALKEGKDPTRGRKEPATTVDPRIGIANFGSQAERTPKGKIFAKVEDAEAYDPFQLVVKVPRAQPPHLCIDCGTEDRLIGSNQAFLKVLMDNKIPFTYAQSEGGHNPPYWLREVRHSMAIQNAILQRSLAAANKTAPQLKRD